MSETNGTHKLCESCIDKILEVLNRVLKADHDAIKSLMRNRVICNDTLADDPTVQVWRNQNDNTVTAMGLINGIVGADDLNRSILAYVADETDNILGFEKFNIDHGTPSNTVIIFLTKMKSPLSLRRQRAQKTVRSELDSRTVDERGDGARCADVLSDGH